MSQTPPDDAPPEFSRSGSRPPDDSQLDYNEPLDPRDEYASRARKRAALTLVVLAVAAALIAAFMTTLGHGSHTPAAKRPAPVPSEASSAPGSPHPTATTPRHTVATTPAAPVGATSCTPTPCVLAGDAGRVVAAINAYRAAGGAPPVTGSASAAAASCAIHNGDSQSCPGSYYWSPVSALRGSEVVGKIAGYGNGRTWLLNRSLTRVAIGCAQTGPGGYECAVVDAGAR